MKADAKEAAYRNAKKTFMVFRVILLSKLMYVERLMVQVLLPMLVTVDCQCCYFMLSTC